MAKKKTSIESNTIEKSFSLERRELKGFYLRANLPTVIAWTIMLIGGIVATFFTPFGACVILFSLVYLGWYLVRVALAYRRTVRDGTLFEPVSIRLTERGIRTDRGECDGREIPWTALARVQKSGAMYVFRLTSKQTVLIPRRVFSAGEERWLDGEVSPFVRAKRTAK